MRTLTILKSTILAATLSVASSAAFAGVIGVFDQESGAADEIAAALAELDGAGADTTGVIALGKMEPPNGFVNGFNASEDDYGLGLGAIISDAQYDGDGDLTQFDMALDAVVGYTLFAVLIKSSQEFIIYYDNMFDDMTTAGLLGGKGVSHISYFGTENSTNVVPLPAAGLLLLMGLGGLGAMSRRKNT